MSPRQNHQLSLGPLQLSNETRDESLRTKSTQQAPSASESGAATSVRANETQSSTPRPNETPLTPEQAHALSGEMFDCTLTRARIETAEVAYVLGRYVDGVWTPMSESVVRRWRSKDARERISYAQELRLPVTYHVAKFKEQNERFGYGRRALIDLVEAAGVLALLA